MNDSTLALDPPQAEETPLVRTLAAMRRGVGEGVHHGAQLYVSLGGETVADFALGRRRRDQPMTRDTLMIWLSSSKPVAAVAIAQLWEKGELELDDPLAAHVPEFAVRGKEAITLRHVLTHTGGFRLLNLPWPAASWEELIERIAGARPEPRWTPGEKAGYHMQASWFMLGEVVRRLDGRSYDAYVREEIFEPLGMDDCWIGMPVERFRERPHAVAPLYDTDVTTPEGSPGSAPGWRAFAWHKEPYMTHVNPAANGVGPMRQLARFYRMLLGRGALDGRRLLTPQTVEALTAPHRVGLLDHTFKVPMDWGLGFIINSEHYNERERARGDAATRPIVPYGYGPHASRRTFGHSGRRSSTAFADPEHHLVVAAAFNGIPAEDTHRARTQALTAAIYEDLGLVKS